MSSDDGAISPASTEFDFPPPPAELLANSNHSKQLSEASILSEASTLKQRKTPSVESLDALPTMNGYSGELEANANDHNRLIDLMTNLSAAG